MRRAPTTYKELHGFILQDSDKAVKFKVDMPGNLLHGFIGWLPLSQIDRIARSHKHDDETFDQIWLADWLFKRKAEDFANISDDDGSY